jgi:hypothetical protein
MKKTLSIGSIFVFGLGLSIVGNVAHATPAPSPCATVGTPFITLTQNITNDPDSGNYSDWATDAFTEHVNVWMGSDGVTYCANANTTNGTFVTTGPNSPEKGTPLAAGITGTFTGGENYTIPSSMALAAGYSTSTPTTTVLGDSNTAGFSWWVNSVFPSIATSSGADYVNTYSLTYVTAHDGTWTDADPSSGGDKGDIGPVVDETTGTGYSTIQAAVASSTAGDTIDVSAGTYPESVTIDKALTLNGAQAGVPGANASGTQRSGAESIVNEMSITASNVVVNGFTFANNGAQMDIDNPPTSASGIVVENNIFSGYSSVGMPTNHAGDLVISGNLFEDPASNSESIQIKSDSNAGGCDGTQVENNVFLAAGNNGGADVNFSCTGSNSSNVTVSGNVDTGNTNYTSFVAFSGIAGGITVTNNTLTTSGSAIYFWGGVSGAVNISGNAITGGGSKAVNIENGGSEYGGTNTGTFTISDNNFSNNAYGIEVGSGAVSDASTVVASGNNFSGEATAGVENDATPTSSAVVATGNWWGAADGPYDAVSGDGSTPDMNAAGTGSAAIGAVDYDSWCTNSVCDEVPPTVAVTPVAGSVLHGTVTFNITVTDNNPLDPTKNTHVWVYLYNTTGSSASQGASVDLSNGTGTFTVDTTKLHDGIAWLDVGQVFDAAGNPSGPVDNYFKNYDIENSTSGPSVPTLLWPVNGDITPTNVFTFTWDPSTATVPGPVTYEFHSSMNPAETDGILTTGLWDSGTLTTSSILSTGAPDGTWYWQVRAIDADGNMSAWSPVWAVTLDTVPPPALASCPAGDSPTLVETDAVNSDSYVPTVGSNTLANGKTYLLVASGTWQNGGTNVADAGYGSVDDWTTYMQGYDISPYDLGSGEFQLQVDNSFVNWGAYQPAHQYSYLYTGTGNPIDLMVFDGDSTVASATPDDAWYADNSGSLMVDVYACNAPAVYITTDPATNVSSTDATLNGVNVDDGATGHSFWVSTSTFSTATPNIPSGVYSTPDFGAIAASTTFSATLSSLTTNAVLSGGAPGTMPAVTPNTTYYYAAWSDVGGTWYPGAVLSFTTAPAPNVITDAATDVAQTGATVNGTNGPTNADNTSFWWGTTPAGPFTAGGNTTEFPASGWTHDTGLGAALAGGSFNEALTGLTPGTTYYYVAWSELGGVWYPGDVLTFATPALDSDDTLSALGVSAGVLTPAFDPGTTSYTDALPFDTTIIPTATATTTDANATDTITQATSTTGTATVAVTAQDGSSTQDYTVAFSLIPATSSILNVAVVVDNTAGGSAAASDFTVNLIATNPSTSTFPGSAGTAVMIDPGTPYNVNISSLANYTEGTSGDCDDVSGIAAGGSATCTITETFTAPVPLTTTFSGGGNGGGNGGDNGFTTPFFTSGGNSGGGGVVLGASTTNPGALLALEQQLVALEFKANGCSTFTFDKNLHKGMTDPEVEDLQTVLNFTPLTQVASTGPGSPGNETTYFGSTTKNAVIAFQNIFATQILAPLGLTTGTGYVGPETRTVLNDLCSQ